MTRKDFRAIAEIVNRASTNANGYKPVVFAIVDITEEIADYLATTNPLFDRKKFLSACGF